MPCPESYLQTLHVVAGAYDGDVVDAQGFSLGYLAVGDLQHFVKEILPELFDAHALGDGGAGVEVDVAQHLLKRGIVARKLDDRHDRVARGGAASGGEHRNLGAPGSHAREGGHVVAGGIHDHQAFLGDRTGVIHHFQNGGMTALVDAAERLFLNGGQAAFLVAGRGIAVAQAGAGLVQMVFIAVDDFIDAVVHFLVGRALGEDMFRTDEFRGFTENGRRAVFDQQVAHGADDRVGRQAGGGVGAAAFRAHDEFGNVDGFAYQLRGVFHHLAGEAGTFVDRADGPAVFLDHDQFHRLVGGFLDVFHHHRGDGVFTAEAHDHCSIDIGVGGKADHDIHGELEIFRRLGATVLLGERGGAFHGEGNRPGCFRGTAHRGQNENLVANAEFAVRAFVTHKMHMCILHKSGMFEY